MSRAFIREEDDYVAPGRFGLPPRDDPDFAEAAAWALLEAARDGNTESGEVATGYRWGEPVLRRYIRQILDQAKALPEEEQDRRFIRVAQRYLASSS